MRVALSRVGAALALLLTVGGCGTGGGTSVADKDTLVIGVSKDQPGLGKQQPDGTFQGFDIDVARYIAAHMEKKPKKVDFKVMQYSQRESSIQTGKVDLVISSYSITPERKTKVSFAGPYYVAHQDTLVRAADTGIKNVRDLAGRRLCAVTGSVSWQRVTVERGVAAHVVNAPTYGDCMTKLTGNSLDAVSTDDLILAGFAAQEGRSVRFVNAPISDERYGVGIRQDDITGCEDINKAITEMYLDGTAAKLLQRWFGATGLHLTTTVPQFEGCG
ncbi:glutamate ABC transporter substrate-binding protein [Actinoallomurus iriomotensis]|uniref:Glutamate-binding protein n=1 Tax=Actinoallomurus iriomotensis TaxID=478107 RepID=A0A9W6VVX3_9ACTN|nr:glutamate ABC transporter substrate-binding protein [Actinoallomurus iriomotensis]GLY82265.1 glutamate-binding protein [Actinoallomurus iriomotensis]